MSNGQDTADRQVLRVPLATELSRRVGQAVTSTDAQMINCYTDIDPATSIPWCVQRPGVSAAFTYNGAGATNGQGMTYWKGCLFAMGSNTLYRVNGSAAIGSDLTAWLAKTDGIWGGRANFASCVFQGQIWIYGGIGGPGGFTHYNDLWSSPDGINWTPIQMSSAPTARAFSQLVAFNDQMFLIGGSVNGTFANDVWSTTDGVNWSQVVSSAPWTARAGHACVAVNMGIVVMGGVSAAGPALNDVWFSGDGITWTQSTNAAGWTARSRHSSVFWQGKIWVIGGYDGANALADVWWSIDAVNWTSANSLPAGRYYASTCVYRNQIFVISGNNTAGIPQATVYNLQSVAGVWQTTTSGYPKPVFGGAALPLPAPASVSAITPTLVWVVGGFDGTVYSSHIYQSTININLPTSWAVATGGATTDQFSFTTDDLGQYLVFKNTTDAWIVDCDVLSQITDTNFPKATVPGIVTLDDTVYVMDTQGTIFGATISYPYVWNPLSFVTAEFEADTPIALAKHQNYVVALKSTSTQFFYDAGIAPPDAPIAPLQNANVNIGCAQALSVAHGANTLFWVACTKQRGPFVVMLDGLTPAEISNPTINAILANESQFGTNSVKGWCIQTQGHLFYVMTSANSNWTYVYDVDMKRWHQWQFQNTGRWAANRYATDGVSDYLQNDTLGIVYKMDESLLVDAGTPYNVQVTTPLLDGKNNMYKFCWLLELIGDPGNYTVTIAWSDDNYATFTSPGTLSMNGALLPRFGPIGAFRRRAFRFTAATGVVKIRWQAVDLYVDQGAF